MNSRARRSTSTPGVYARVTKAGRRVYDIAFWIDTPAGKRKKWESAFPTKNAAVRRRNAVMVQLGNNTYVAPNERRLGEYIRELLEQRFALGNIAESTFRGDLRLLNTHLPEDLAAMPLQKLKASHLTALYLTLAASGRKDGRPGGLSPRTIQRLHVLIGHSLKEAMIEELVPVNVAKNARLPRGASRKVPAMTIEEVRQLLEVAKGDWFYAFYVLAITTGMRRGEICGLTWSNVRLEQAELLVERTLVSVEHHPVWSSAKTSAGNRVVTLDPFTVDVLREHRRRVAEAKLLHGSTWLDKDDLVFPRPDGSGYNPEILYMRFVRLVKKAGLPHYSLHAVRHTYATLARREGMDMKVLSERLGHSKPMITMSLYQHVPQDAAREAADSVANAILEIQGRTQR